MNVKDRTGEVWEDLEEDDVFLVVGPPEKPSPEWRPGLAYHPVASLLDAHRWKRIERVDRLGHELGWDSDGKPMRRLA